MQVPEDNPGAQRGLGQALNQPAPPFGIVDSQGRDIATGFAAFLKNEAPKADPNLGQKLAAQRPITPTETAILNGLAVSTSYPLLDLVALYRHVGGSFDHTIRIAVLAQRSNASILDLIAQSMPASPNGSVLDPEELTMELKIDANRLYLELNRPVQYLVLTKDGAKDLGRQLRELAQQLPND